ncbi:MAG: DUF2156 domain-containing protein, partial [Clostridia bacterium]|nr:DUF2156 domain-containing protein [Clostridia bacterium]
MITKQKVKTIDINDGDRLKELLDTNVTAEICDNSVGNIFMWKDTLDTETVGDAPFCIAEHYEGNTYFALRRADGCYIERIKALIGQFGLPLYLCSMTDAETEDLKKEFGERFSFEGEDGAADYIYDAESLRAFRGKKFHSQKNHMNAFLKQFSNYTFLPYKSEEERELFAFFDRYEEAVNDMTASAKKESLACRRLIPVLPKLPVDARVLRVDGEIIGFAVMERICDTLMIHIEKGLPSYRGVYPMLVNLEANAYPDVKYINREEDDANEGLRRSKESYNPIMLKQKYLGIIE